MHKEQRLTESIKLGQSSFKDNVLENVAVLGPTSENGKGRNYTKRYMESAQSLYEGIAVTIDHPTKEQRKNGQDRGLLSKVGKLEGVQVLEVDGVHCMKAKRLILNPGSKDFEHVKWMAENTPEHLGLSHDVIASGKVDKETGRFIAEECRHAFEVALVSSPGTNKNLFEEEEPKEEPNKLKGKEEMTIDFKNLTLSELKENRPDIYEIIVQQSQESQEQKAKREAEAKELAELRERFKKVEAKEAVEKLCKDSELPKEAISEAFMEALVNASDDDKRKALIEDRKTLIGSKTQSNIKSKGRQPFSEDQHSQENNNQESSFSSFSDNKALAEALLKKPGF